MQATRPAHSELNEDRVTSDAGARETQTVYSEGTEREREALVYPQWLTPTPVASQGREGQSLENSGAPEGM